MSISGREAAREICSKRALQEEMVSNSEQSLQRNGLLKQRWRFCWFVSFTISAQPHLDYKNLKKPWRGWWWKQALQKSGLTQQGRAFKASPDPQSLRQTRLLLILSSSSHSYCNTEAENEKFQWAKTCKRERKTWKFPPIIPSLKEPGYIYLSKTSCCVDSIGELFKCHGEVLNIAV